MWYDNSCTINGSIICPRVVISSSSQLTGVKVGTGYEVAAGEWRNEVLCRERDE